MSQQEMGYGELNRDRPSYGRYEGNEGFEGVPHYNTYGQKLSGQAIGASPTAGQRLALAIVSLAMLMIMTFGLIGIAIATHPPDWAVIPILFILVLFSSAAVIINILFNRKP